jgi:hypothetical protein
MWEGERVSKGLAMAGQTMDKVLPRIAQDVQGTKVK